MDQVSYLSPNFTEIVGAFTTRANIYIDTPDVCGDNCTAVVQVIPTPLETLDLADMVSRDLDSALIVASPKLRSMAPMQYWSNGDHSLQFLYIMGSERRKHV
jgi:hypothetical protein